MDYNILSTTANLSDSIIMHDFIATINKYENNDRIKLIFINFTLLKRMMDLCISSHCYHYTSDDGEIFTFLHLI